MKDKYGRQIEYLRVSVTQRCNLKCIYCKPDNNTEESCTRLSPQEFGIIVEAMAALGIRKVRLTGGEPLTRPDICEIVAAVSQINGIEDLSMTTNGLFLGKMAKKLKTAGLKRVNISLDSLDSSRFQFITGGGSLEDTISGIDAAIEAGLNPVKVNVVLIKGINDSEIEDFFELARNRDLDVRFIELMPVGDFGEKGKDKVIYNTDIISAHPELIPCKSNEAGPAENFTIEGFKGRIGFISPMSHKFCNCCNRIRLTCDGRIKPCLGDNGEVDIVKVLRENPLELKEYIKSTIFNKPEGHNFDAGFSSKRNMSAIGG
jgi:GTP 3',8-cyclase